MNRRLRKKLLAKRQPPKVVPRPKFESLNNFYQCMHSIEFANHNCGGCQFEPGCVFRDKENYGRYRL